MALTQTLSYSRENYRRHLPLVSGSDKFHRWLLSSDSDGDTSIRLALTSVREDVFAVIGGDQFLLDRIWIGGRTPIGWVGGSALDLMNCGDDCYAWRDDLNHKTVGGGASVESGDFWVDGGTLASVSDPLTAESDTDGWGFTAPDGRIGFLISQCWLARDLVVGWCGNKIGVDSSGVGSGVHGWCSGKEDSFPAQVEVWSGWAFGP